MFPRRFRDHWQTHSSDVPLEAVKELLAGELPAQTKQLIEQSRVAYFNLAHELHKPTLAIAGEHETRSESCQALPLP